MKFSLTTSEIQRFIRLARESGDPWNLGMKTDERIIIDYTNWRAERSTRTIIPKSIYFGSNEFHKEPQWLLMAHDVEKDAPRTFAMLSIHSWRRQNPLEAIGQTILREIPEAYVGRMECPLHDTVGWYWLTVTIEGRHWELQWKQDLQGVGISLCTDESNPFTGSPDQIYSDASQILDILRGVTNWDDIESRTAT